MLFLSVTSLVVPESSGLSTPVRDSRESTHPCTDHFNSNAKKRVPYCGGSASGETGGTFHMPACVERWALW